MNLVKIVFVSGITLFNLQLNAEENSRLRAEREHFQRETSNALYRHAPADTLLQNYLRVLREFERSNVVPGDFVDLKRAFEKVLKERNFGEPLKYNKDASSLYSPIIDGKLQCRSGTVCFHSLAYHSLGPDYLESMNALTIYTEGHVLPGFAKIGASGTWEIFGIETTVGGRGLVPFGPASQLANLEEPLRVITAKDYLYSEWLLAEGKEFEAKRMEGEALAFAANKYGIPVEQLERRIQNIKDAPHRRPFEFGIPDVPEGDRERPVRDEIDIQKDGVPGNQSARKEKERLRREEEEKAKLAQEAEEERVRRAQEAEEARRESILKEPSNQALLSLLEARSKLDERYGGGLSIEAQAQLNEKSVEQVKAELLRDFQEEFVRRYLELLGELNAQLNLKNLKTDPSRYEGEPRFIRGPNDPHWKLYIDHTYRNTSTEKVPAFLKALEQASTGILIVNPEKMTFILDPKVQGRIEMAHEVRSPESFKRSILEPIPSTQPTTQPRSENDIKEKVSAVMKLIPDHAAPACI